ncbi:MAG TPA: hypothetical protein VL069_16970 [Opitutus sp.]|nr:hypothetical protein [Opitutus sp.]
MNLEAKSPRRAWVTRAAWAFAAFVLALWFYSPVTTVLDSSLDASNYASYTQFTSAGRQFGTEVVPMAGPYSFVVYGWVYSGELYELRFALELLTKIGFAALVLWFFHQARGDWSRWLWLAAHLLIVPATHELGYDFAILYAALFLLVANARPLPATMAVVFLAFLSLCKGTQLTFTLAVLSVVLCHRVWNRNWRGAALLIGGYLAALAAFWMAAGQSLRNFPAFARNIQQLSSGYHGAMALQETSLTFVVGVATFLLLLSALGLLLYSHRRNSTAIATAALLAGFAALQWKHGFVRADGHVFLFFHYAVIGALTAVAIDRVIGVAPRFLAARAGIGAIAIALSLFATGENAGGRLIHQGTFVIEHLSSVVRQVTHPSEHKHQLAAQLERNRARFALPAVVSQVETASIDFFGQDLGYLLLNDLNYQPRPVGGGSFGVFTSQLRQLNEEHLSHPFLRPEYYLLNLQTIDQRLPSQDDAGTLNEILYGYRPVLGERQMLLLQASRPRPQPPALRLVSRVDLRVGDVIEVPAVNDHDILVAAFKLPPSLPGLARGLAYKPAIVSLSLLIAGSDDPVIRRIVPSMVSRPIILSPLIETADEFLALYTSAPGRGVRSFKIIADPSWALNDEAGSVIFYAQPRPSALDPVTARDLHDQLAYPMASRPPDSIESPHAQAREIDGRLVQVVEPPGRLVFNLRGDERELRFDYAIAPEAYQRGTTDGADFTVDLIVPGATAEQLFISRRDPKANAADRGLHHAQFWLPLIPPGAQLVLHTSPGPHGDAQWDWTYFDNIRLRHGPPQLEQFPGFSRVPFTTEGSSPRVIVYEGQNVLLANAPSALGFELTGADRAVKFLVGFIAGAYTEGNTDGADFIVELQSPNEPRREIYRVGLHPKSVEADRGSRALRIDLPVVPAGSQLYLRIDPGPNNDRSWDWTYVADVRFE